MNAPRPPYDRKQFLGGSDAAAILGVSPWHTPLDLYLIKTGQKLEVTDPARERLFRRGKRMEPHVLDDLIELYGIKVTKRSTPEHPNRYLDVDLAFLAAEIDFEWEVTPEIAMEFDLPQDLVGTIQNGEVKTVHPLAVKHKYGQEGTDEIPVEYGAQAMHGLMVKGAQLCLVVVGVDANDPLVYWIWRDEETIAAMRAKEIAFWNDHVLAGVPPQPVNLPDVFELFSRKPASRVAATAEVADKVAQLNAARATVKEHVDIADELRFQIAAFMLGGEHVSQDRDGNVVPGPEVKLGEHHLLVEGRPILRVVKQVQTRIDPKAVAERFPQIIPEVSKTISFFKFAKPLKEKRK